MALLGDCVDIPAMFGVGIQEDGDIPVQEIGGHRTAAVSGTKDRDRRNHGTPLVQMEVAKAPRRIEIDPGAWLRLDQIRWNDLSNLMG